MLRQFVSDFLKFRYVSVFLFFCCHFEIVVLQNDLVMFKGDANEDLVLSWLIFYNFNGLNTVIL